MVNTDDLRFYTEVGTGYTPNAMMRVAANEIDLLRSVIAALADTELRDVACMGSDAPVEDLLGRLFALVPNAELRGATDD